MSREIFCQKLTKYAEGLERPPYPDLLGQRIYNHISKEAWQLWLVHQTKIINENRLALADPKARERLKAELEIFLFNDKAL